MTPASRWMIALVLLPLCALCAALGQAAAEENRFADLAPPKPAVALDPTSVDLKDVDCVECHRAVGDEWAATAHAVAWADKVYQAKIAERSRPELCASCHIPQPLLASGTLATRVVARADGDEPRAHGITCKSCHAGPDGVMLGAHGAPTDAHPTATSPWMTSEKSSELCAGCHRTNIGPVVGIAKDFPDSKAAAAGGSCVGCHMAVVERAPASASGDPPAEGAPKIAGRSHAIQTPRDPAFLARAFDLSFVVERGSTRVLIANRAGHRVPGLIGRELRFRATGKAGGAEVGKGELVLDTNVYLPVDGTLELKLAGAADEVHVVAEHVDPRHASPVVFLDRAIEKASSGTR